jgi:hypothetical protein
MPAASLDPDVRDFLAARPDGHVLAGPRPGRGGAGEAERGWAWAPPVLPGGFRAAPGPMPPPLLAPDEPAMPPRATLPWPTPPPEPAPEPTLAPAPPPPPEPPQPP